MSSKVKKHVFILTDGSILRRYQLNNKFLFMCDKLKSKVARFLDFKKNGFEERSHKHCNKCPLKEECFVIFEDLKLGVFNGRF